MLNNVIRSIAIMLIGLVLIFMSDSAMILLVRLTGAAFFLPALVSIINLYVSRSESGVIPKVLISVIDVGSMAFGVWLMMAPDLFQDVFVFDIVKKKFFVFCHHLFAQIPQNILFVQGRKNV